MYIGVDIETTGLDPAKDHRLIQIGIFYGGQAGISESRDIYPRGNMKIDAEALEVNGFDLKRIAEGEPTDVVDMDLYNLLHGIYGYKEGSLTAVGWNVGSFDFSFIRKELPNTASLFSHRCLDLSGACMLIADANKWGSWRDLKAHIQKKVEEQMAVGGIPARWHDALWDAEAAYKAVPIMVEMIKNGV